MENTVKKIFVTGHRNPDIDSLVAAYALAELRRRQGVKNVVPICPGILSDRAKFLFDRFQIPPPEPRFDVYLRAEDILDDALPPIRVGTPLLEAVRQLKDNPGYPRLPIVDQTGKLVGMLSPISLLSSLLDVDRASGSGLAGRLVRSSIDLITQVIEAQRLTVWDPEIIQNFKVYVAAMGMESFDSHIPAGDQRELALISGDRPEIHLQALQRRLRLLIVTGDKAVDPLILKEAEARQVSVLKTRFDSATVIRRLKFSVPVEDLELAVTGLTLKRNDRIRGLEHLIMSSPEDVIPVVGDDGSYQGVIRKLDVSATPPYRMILVDHNEQEQSLPGLDEIPVIEVVDHHRIGSMRTSVPIKFTGDVVGSTCTLIAAMFKSCGESLTPELAGLLLSGLVTDTLNLKSPTTAMLDRRICEWLEKISGVRAGELMQELSQVDSPLATAASAQVVESDRKSYRENGFSFSLSQVEETNLELLRNRREELTAEMTKLMQREKLDFIGLLVTDAVREISELLILGDPAVISRLPYRSAPDGLLALPGVLSRKKQLLPQILAILAELKRI